MNDDDPYEQQSPDYWRSRAWEARTVADQMTTEDARETMLRIADRYEALAARAAHVDRRAS